MRKLVLLFYILVGVNLMYGQEGTNILVLYHDTTYTTSQLKRLADRDTFMTSLTAVLASFNVATFDTNTTLTGLSSYKSIIVQETSFDVANARYFGRGARDSIKAWLSSGTSQDIKTLVLIGADEGYNYSRTGSSARDTAFSSGFLKFNYRLDDGNVTGQNSITGVNIDIGNVRPYTTTPVGSGFYPDAVQPLGSTVLYQYTGRGATDSVAAVAVVDTGYIAITQFLDPRYFTGVTEANGNFQEVLLELLLYAVANGGSFPGIIPVELTSFAASSVGSKVNLSWTTATELNNRGFEVERSLNNSDWQKIGFVQGYGTTTESKYYSYADSKLSNGHYFYRLKQVDFNGTFEYSPVVEVDVEIPAQFALHQNYPNPFNPVTKINFSLAVDSKVILKIFDILGQEVITLVNGNLTAGNQGVDFNGAGLNSGVYMYKLEATGIDGSTFSSVKKMLLNK